MSLYLHALLPLFISLHILFCDFPRQEFHIVSLLCILQLSFLRAMPHTPFPSFSSGIFSGVHS